jgi:hypothetical protein
VVAGVAVLGLVFTAHGGYALPRGRGLTEPPTRCDNDARDAVSAGAAG